MEGYRSSLQFVPSPSLSQGGEGWGVEAGVKEVCRWQAVIVDPLRAQQVLGRPAPGFGCAQASVPRGAGLFCIRPTASTTYRRPGAGRAALRADDCVRPCLGPAADATGHFRPNPKTVGNHHPKAVVMVRVVRIVPVARGHAGVLLIVVPRPAAQGPRPVPAKPRHRDAGFALPIQPPKRLPISVT